MFKLNVKRLYLPFDFMVKCPSCKSELNIDYRKEYLSFPIINETFEQIKWCNHCDHEFPIKINLNIDLQIKL